MKFSYYLVKSFVKVSLLFLFTHLLAFLCLLALCLWLGRGNDTGLLVHKMFYIAGECHFRAFLVGS